ncbi:MAG: CoB--CoM heterodisulfide reductase iron-sulfur subunit B family protein [Planctomycetota bacterium]
MKVAYYPGCTLKTYALGLEESCIAALSELGVELSELPRWNCCGTVYSLSSDNLIFQTAPFRNLLRVKEQKQDTFVTLCSMCYNTLRRANKLINEDKTKLEKLNLFTDTEAIQYQGDVKVLHILEFLRDVVGFSNIKEKVKKPLTGLKVACYWGCLLTRPENVGFDDVENPSSMEKLISILGAEPVTFPFKMECCGSYETVANPDAVAERTYRIVSSASRNGADIIITSCPLCEFNLDERQKEARSLHGDLVQIPVLYITQLLSIALGLGSEVCRFEKHLVDPKPVLQAKNLI